MATVCVEIKTSLYDEIEIPDDKVDDHDYIYTAINHHFLGYDIDEYDYWF